jgi:hypothetical protein
MLFGRMQLKHEKCCSTHALLKSFGMDECARSHRAACRAV